MPTDTESAKDFATAEIASYLGNNTNAKAEVSKQRTRRYHFYKTAVDGAAGTASAETTFNWNDIFAAGKVVAIKIKPTAALTGDPTNNATITFTKRDAAGGSLTTLGAITTTVSWVAGVTVTLSAAQLTAANLAVVAGGALTMAITKGGTGVVVPISTYAVDVEDT